MPSIKQDFLQLVKLGIGHSRTATLSVNDWSAIEALATKQGLLGVLIDAIEQIPEPQRPPKQILLLWIGEVMEGYEKRFLVYRSSLAELAAFYDSHGYKMMVLKGYACGLNWPKIEHRPYGDIDIWLFGEQKKADAMMASEKGIYIDKSHQHHTVFTWGDFSVENHYDFGNVHHHKSSAKLEKVFKELGKDDSHFVELQVASHGSATKVYLPSPNLHALFLLKHAMTDFAAFFVTLRQVLDWAFYVEKYSNEIDWDWLHGVIEQYHMTDFFNCINAICVEDLGFDASIFHGVQFNPSLKEKILADILLPEFSRVPPDGRLLPKALYMYRRWKGNEWKHKMCYNESMWSAFWSGIGNHLIKPEAFKSL